MTSATVRPDDALVGELAERLAGAPRGLIFCGRQTDPALAPAVASLARAAGYPVLAEPTSQLRLGDHDRGPVVWAYEAIARVRPRRLEPELVIRFGDMPTSKPLRQWLGSLDATRQLVIDPAYGWNEPSRRAETIVRSDPVDTARGLAEALAAVGGDSSWAEAWREAGEAAAGAIEAELDALDEPTEPGAHRALARLYADGDLVYTASSMPIRDQEAFVPSAPGGVRFLCNRGANGIDGFVSSGLGAAIASGRPTWIITGDLGLYHDMNGLAAFGEVETPVRLVVLNNDGGGIFEFLPQAGQIDREEFEALFGTPLGLDLARVAGLHDLRYSLAQDLRDLAPAAARGGLIEIPVDRRANVELHRRIAERAAEAVGAAAGR